MTAARRNEEINRIMSLLDYAIRGIKDLREPDTFYDNAVSEYEKNTNGLVKCNLCDHYNIRHNPNWTIKPYGNEFNGWHCSICNQICVKNGYNKKPIPLKLEEV